MYLDFLVKIPDAPGKLAKQKKGDTVYIDFAYARSYDPAKRYTYPKRATIGKLSAEDPTMMWPNQNFLKYFPDAELPEERNRTVRSSCLKVGSWFVIRKIINDYKLPDLLSTWFSDDEVGLLLDLAAYSIITEDNAAQYYPG